MSPVHVQSMFTQTSVQPPYTQPRITCSRTNNAGYRRHGRRRRVAFSARKCRNVCAACVFRARACSACACVRETPKPNAPRAQNQNQPKNHAHVVPRPRRKMLEQQSVSPLSFFQHVFVPNQNAKMFSLSVCSCPSCRMVAEGYVLEQSAMSISEMSCPPPCQQRQETGRKRMEDNAEC